MRDNRRIDKRRPDAWLEDLSPTKARRVLRDLTLGQVLDSRKK